MILLPRISGRLIRGIVTAKGAETDKGFLLQFAPVLSVLPSKPVQTIPIAEAKDHFWKHSYIKTGSLSAKDVDQALKAQKKHSIAQKSLQLFSQQSKFGETEKDFINRFVRYWAAVLVSKFRNHKDVIVQKATVDKLMTAIGKALLLVEIDDQFSFNYLHMLDNASYAFRKDYVKEYTNYVRLVMDKILYSIETLYFTRKKEIINYLFRHLPENWHENNVAFSVLKGISRVSELTLSLKDKILMIILRSYDSKIQHLAFNVALSFRVIDKQSLKQPRFLKFIEKAIHQDKDSFFRTTFVNLYRAQIWLENYWLQFYKWISLDNNYERVDTYSLICLDKVLEIEAEIIPTTIVSAGEAFKRSLNARDINILNTDLKSMYLKNFIKRDMGYIHSTVAKALLFSPKVEVQTEKLISIFFVDILINGKFVLQINNSSHYKTIDGVSSPDLKTSFRRRILRKSGYPVLELKIDQFLEVNFFVISSIHEAVDILEQSGKDELQVTKLCFD